MSTTSYRNADHSANRRSMFRVGAERLHALCKTSLPNTETLENLLVWVGRPPPQACAGVDNRLDQIGMKMLTNRRRCDHRITVARSECC